MILKVQTTDAVENAWRFFDANAVQYTAAYDPSTRVIDLSYTVERLTFTSETPGTPAIVVSFFDNNDQPIEVSTDMTVYLLNNVGQTIERLN